VKLFIQFLLVLENCSWSYYSVRQLTNFLQKCLKRTGETYLRHLFHLQITSHHILVLFFSSSNFNTFRHDLNSLIPCQNQNFPISFMLEFTSTCVYFSEFGICLQKHCHNVSFSHTRAPRISLGEFEVSFMVTRLCITLSVCGLQIISSLAWCIMSIVF
jgi:hypothetical protein